MKREIVKSLTDTFQDHSNTTDNGIEFWFARDIQHLLGYSEWRNFTNVITKAKTSCEASGNNISDHFVDINKMVNIGSAAQKPVDDISAEHIKNNKGVRKLLLDRGIKPEELPAEEDIKKLERRVKSEEKQIGRKPEKLSE